jgi:hypothetical protein
MVETMGIKIIAMRSPSISNFIKIYQVVQRISTHDLYLRTASPFGRFYPTVNSYLQLPW